MSSKSVSGIFAQMQSRRLNEEKEVEEGKKTMNEEQTGVQEAEGEGSEENTPKDETPAGDETPAANEESSDDDSLDEAMKKVVRNGKVETKKVQTHKKRLTSAQKQALAKARKKAHSGTAEKSRAKSNKKRTAMGLNSEDMIVCPDCGFEGTSEDFDEEDGILYCPECGSEVTKNVEEACKGKKKNEEVDVAELAVRLDECGGSEYMKKALNEGKYDLVQKYLSIKEGE